MAIDDPMPNPILTAEEAALLEANRLRIERDLTEDDYQKIIPMLTELIKLRRTNRDLIIRKLMQINQAARRARQSEETEIAERHTSDRTLPVYDALDKAIAETAAYISSMPDTTSAGIKQEEIFAFIEARAADTMEFNEYQAWRVLGNRFKD